MALYEYRCPQCETTFEKRMPMTEVLEFIPCPSCGAQAKKLMGTFVVVGRAEPSEADKEPPWEREGSDEDDFDLDSDFGHGHSHEHPH